MTRNESRLDGDTPAPEGKGYSTASAETGAEASSRRRPRIPAHVWFALAVIFLIALVPSRSFAQQRDFSIANVVTLIIGFLAWLSLTIGLAKSRLPRWVWRGVALAPLVVVAIGLSMYRVSRFNAELIPQFESRWISVAAPTSDASSTQAEPLPASLLEPRDTDFPQYLGPNRNAVVTGVELETDWKAHPPEVLWKQPIGAGWSSFAVQGDAAITLEQREKEQWVSCYDVETGRMLWHTAIPGYHFNPLGGAGPRSTPTIDNNNRVYVHLATGQVACLELTTGAKVWEVNLLALGGWGEDAVEAQKAAEAVVSWGRAGSPLIVKDMVVVPLGGPGADKASLVALRTSDGAVVWRGGNDQISYSSPMLAKLLGVEQIVIINETTITGHEIDTGAVLWSTPWPGQSSGAASTSQPVVVDDSRLLITKGYMTGSELLQFARSDNGEWSVKVVWKDAKALKTKLTSAVIRNGFAYGLSDGILECVQVSDGEQQWKKGRYRHGQVLLVDDVLLITAENGSVALVAADPSGYKELAKLDVIGDVTWNTPALSGGRLLIRNAEEAACLRLPRRQGAGGRRQATDYRLQAED